jgi:hypothetical protein
MSVWVRRFLTVACLLAAWVVARPAAAAAPMCDARGASMVAPTVVLDPPTASIDVGEHTDGCDAEGAQDKAFHRGERSHRLPSTAHAEAVLAPPTAEVAPSTPDVSPRPELPRIDRSGVRSMLDRPPRQVRLSQNLGHPD